MTYNNNNHSHGLKRPRDDASAGTDDNDQAIKRMRSQDLDYNPDLNAAAAAAAYMQSAYDHMPSSTFAPYPTMAPPQPQASYWTTPADRTPQPQSQPQLQNSQSQYYAPQPDVQPSLTDSLVPGLNQWWQLRPNSAHNSVFDNWNYRIDEPCVYGHDATQHLKLQSVSNLDNLSTQIILNLAKGSLNDIMLLTAGRDHDQSQAYFTRRTLFDQTRKVYTRGSSVFIDMNSLHSFSNSQREVVRKANRTIFISCILEGHDISFFDLDSHFLDTFICPGQRLLKWQGTVFLELKTQAYIAALMNNDGRSDVLLNELFPDDLADHLVARHPDAPNLAPSEQDFIDRARARKQYLFNEPAYDAFTSLPRKYGWHDFLREFAVCINKNVETIINNPARTPSQPPTVSPVGVRPDHSSPFANNFANLGSPQEQQPQSNRITELENVQALSTPLQRIQADTIESASATPDIVERTQSPQTKPRTKPMKAAGGSSTQRQPWKQEEEDALMAGLAEVKGPHWSQILSLYGRGGSVSEVLKDRNQIQLKDKARNLKLYYLKMGKDVPECLKGVTGELRKRGGARVRAALGLTDDDNKKSG